MTTTIQYAQLDDRIVSLADVQRDQKGLTCVTCGDRLLVKDGQGSEIKKTLETERAENKALLPYIEQPVPRGRTCPLPASRRPSLLQYATHERCVPNSATPED